MPKKYKHLGQTLKNLLFLNEMNVSDLARALDMPQPTVHRLVTGKSQRPYRSSLEPIADYFSISVEQLVGEENLPEKWSIDKSKLKQSQDHPQDLPVYEWNVEQYEKKVPYDYVVPSRDTPGIGSFALIMSDSSMEPIFPKGTVLIFNTQIEPTDRNYVLVKLDTSENLVFRQLLIDADYKYLKSINPDLHSHQMRVLSENDQITACLIESRLCHKPLITSNTSRGLI